MHTTYDIHILLAYCPYVYTMLCMPGVFYMLDRSCLARRRLDISYIHTINTINTISDIITLVVLEYDGVVKNIAPQLAAARAVGWRY